jgi:hypothetical protein
MTGQNTAYMKSAWTWGLAVPLAASCGGQTVTHSSIVLPDSDGGSDGGGVGPFEEQDAGPSGLSVSVVPGSPALCAGQCVTLTAQASGGVGPYVYASSPGGARDGGTIDVCPGSSTTYTITATDSSGHGGELAGTARTGSATVTVAVSSCGDAATMAPAGPCDSVTDVSPSGANPDGAWSYGWSSSLGSAFSRYTQFFPATSASNGYPLDAWTSGSQAFLQDPGGSLPAAFFNASATVVQLSTLTAQAGQFLLHPGPVGQYSITRWTAASAGAYEVQATFQGIDSGPTTTDANVQHNGQNVAPAGYINVNGGGNSASFAVRIVAAAGDTIDFALGDGGNGYISDSTALEATVCPTGPVALLRR